MSDIKLLRIKRGDNPMVDFSEELEYKLLRLVKKILQGKNHSHILQELNSTSRPILVNNGSFQGEKEIILAWDPIEAIVFENGITLLQSNNTSTEINFVKDIPDILTHRAEFVNNLSTDDQQLALNYIGFYGYLSYELSRHLEKFENRGDKELIPSSVLLFPSKYLIEKNDETILIWISKVQKLDLSMNHINDIKFVDVGIRCNTPLTEYLEQSQNVINHIYAGDIYQANYTQNFSIGNITKNSRSIFEKLYKDFPVDHAAYIELDEFQILSISPELFLRIENGRVVTKPIKGTIARGLTPEEDKMNAEQLLASTKDNAELSMIVDLLRNDLGKSSLPTSILVEKHAELESFSNVHHLVSTVTANINISPEATWNLILRAFPGGSITGVPKLRAMEIIESTETTPRGVYTGSIGYIALNGNAEFNIAIRTILKNRNTVIFNAGGGIVADSEPYTEYMECLHKAKHIANFFGESFTGMIAWKNGSYCIRNAIEKLEYLHQHVGFFETILIDHGIPQDLDRHKKRFERGKEYYRISDAEFPSKQQINKLLKLNLVSQGRLKIAVIVENTKCDIIMLVDEYNNPVKEYSLLLREFTFNQEIKDAVEKGIKPLFYNNYLQSTAIAIANNCWDSLHIQNSEFLEGGRCNIYFFHNGKWITPDKYVVQGTIREKLLERAVIEMKSLTLQDLIEVQFIAISNSLIGIQPVSKIIDDIGKIIWNSNTKYNHTMQLLM